jgi:predicted ArsR family transcriptional regulator
LNVESQLFPESTRGRIVAVLRRGAATVDDIASDLGLSDNAVRVQLTRMERDNVVRRVGLHRRTTRPSHLYELTPAVIQLLSRAYVPFLTAVIRTITARHTAKELQSLMREAGKELAEGFRSHVASHSSLVAQLAAASEILNKEFGALTTVERMDGQLAIRGHGCPLAALTGTHPGVCLAIESLLAALLDRRVRQCCSQKHPPQCCFRVPGHRASDRTTK